MLQAAARLIMPQSKMGYNLPDEAWFKFARESARYTPDVAKIEEYEFQLYFACDETQEGHQKYPLLGDNSAYLCPAFTQSSFNYWQTRTPWEPPVPLEAKTFLNPLPYYPEIAKIKGQVHVIRPQVLLTLDNYKENTVQFLRKRVRILVPYRALKFIHDISLPPDDVEFVAPEGHIGRTKEKIAIIRAWMYQGVPEYWNKLISSYGYTGVDTFRSKNRPWCETYYQLRRPK